MATKKGLFVLEGEPDAGQPFRVVARALRSLLERLMLDIMSSMEMVQGQTS